MAGVTESPDPNTLNLEAHASDSARINQAGRDLHVHYQDGVRGVRRAESSAGPEDCPYPGMAYFEREHARWFFGRDQLTAKLISRLDERLRGGGIQVVVAPSGAGKSSLFNAGLLPKLEQSALPGSGRWPTLLFTPTGDPLGALAEQLAALTGADPTLLASELADDHTRCAQVLSDHLAERHRGDRVVLVVDQFEELFSLCDDRGLHNAFVRALVDLASRRTGTGAERSPLGLVVIGVRADFYAACANDPELRGALEDSPVVVGPMSETELREAILYPARDVGLELEPGLVELLLTDLGITPTKDGDRGSDRYEAGRLALLAHALRATWQQRDGHILTVAGYRDTGGIAHAVATTADRIFSGLAPAGQDLAPTLFLRLTKIGDGTEDTRRRVSRVELLDGLSPDIAQPVVDAFTRGRLLTQDQDTVQITHEALLRAWPRLRQWIDGDRAGNLTRQEVEEAAAGWDRDGRDTSGLYRGTRLVVAQARTTSHRVRPNLSPVASEFLTASAAHERRTAQRRVQLIVAVLTLVAVASGLVLQQNITARRQRDNAISHQLRVEADRLRGVDVSLAAQLDVTAYRLSPNLELGLTVLSDATTALSGTPLVADMAQVSAVSFSPDGRTLASGSGAEGTVQLWNVSDPARPTPLGRPLTGHTDWIRSVVFSPDGRSLASVATDGVRLWNVSDPTHPAALGPPMAVHTGLCGSLAFSPDGRTLASTDVEDTMRLWNVSDPAHPVAVAPAVPGLALSLAFAPSGHTVATGGADGAVRLWDVTDPARPVAVGATQTAVGGDYVTSVAFSPDGYTLVSSGTTGLRSWLLTNPAHPTPLAQPLATGYVSSVVFSPDGRTLASDGGDGSVRLWHGSPARPNPLGKPLTGHTDAVRSVAFNRDGRILASASNDGTIRLWHIPQPVRLVPTNSTEAVSALRPDWRVLARRDPDGTMRLWNVSDRAHPVALTQVPAGDQAVFSPDGRSLVSFGSEGARLWDVSDPTRPVPLGRPLVTGYVSAVVFGPGGRSLVSLESGGPRLWEVSDPARPTGVRLPLAQYARISYSVAFAPDGRSLAGIDANGGAMWLWNISDPAHPALLDQPLRPAAADGAVSSLAFSPDGHTLAGGDNNGRVWLWDLSDRAHPKPLDQSVTGEAHELGSLAFSPDGQILAGGDRTGKAWLWSVSDPAHHSIPVGQPLNGGQTEGGVSVAFSPDGQTLASIEQARNVWLWPLSVERAAQQICAGTTNNLSRAKWEQLVSTDLPYDPPCP
jgi:WD40 repeat protein